eukprot:sb/3463966/
MFEAMTSLELLTHRELKEELIALGYTPTGPITDTTRRVYEMKFEELSGGPGPYEEEVSQEDEGASQEDGDLARASPGRLTKPVQRIKPTSTAPEPETAPPKPPAAGKQEPSWKLDRMTSLELLTHRELKEELIALGYTPTGPITDTTRRVYEMKFEELSGGPGPYEEEVSQEDEGASQEDGDLARASPGRLTKPVQRIKPTSTAPEPETAPPKPPAAGKQEPSWKCKMSNRMGVIRQSASCILINKLPTGQRCSKGIFDYRVLFVKRSAKMKSWPGALVFPGGNLDKEEMTSSGDMTSSADFTPLSSIPRGPTPCSRELVYRRAALRELQEETSYTNDSVTTADLIPWSLWQTPVALPVRFNTPIFALFAPSTTALQPQEGEIESLHWLSPLELISNPELTVAPPQITDSLKLFPHQTFSGLREFAVQRYMNHTTHQCTPVLVKFNDGMCAIFPGDSFYEEATRSQLADLKRMLEFDCSTTENEGSQSVLMSVLNTVVQGVPLSLRDL